MFVLAELRCSRFIIDIGFFSVIILKLNDLAHKYTSFLAFAQVVVNLYTCFFVLWNSFNRFKHNDFRIMTKKDFQKRLERVVIKHREVFLFFIFGGQKRHDIIFFWKICS